MRTLLRSATLLLLVVSLVSNCKQNTASTPTPTPPVVVVPQAAPSISGVSPEKAVAGSSLTITGQNLQNAKEVKINGQAVVITNATNTATSLLVLVPELTPALSTTLAVGLTVTTSGGTSSPFSLTVAPQAEIAQTPVPNGLIPGGPLSLTVTNVSGITRIDFMKNKDEVTDTIPASSFLASKSGSIMLKVPIGVSAEWIRVNTEYGYGKPLRISKVTGSDGITTSNIATNVGAITTGIISDGCDPKSFFYCIPLPTGSYLPGGVDGNPGNQYSTSSKNLPDGSRLVMGFRVSPNDNVLKGPPYPEGRAQDYQNCQRQNYYSTELRGSTSYHVFRGYYQKSGGGVIAPEGPWVTLKLERNSLTNAYTGSVIVEIITSSTYTTYVGNMLKQGDIKDTSINGDIYAYSVTTGKEIRLCSQTGFSRQDKDGNLINCSTCN